MKTDQFPTDILRELHRLKSFAERAAAQVDDESFFATLAEDDNSIAILMKHMGGNLRSRWRDFLTTDGEKPDRNRDGEFVIDPVDTRDAILASWEAGWATLFGSLDGLRVDQLNDEVLIRSQPHSVADAIYRSMTHLASHVGQIVLLAKHHAGDAWQTLSIPRGESDDYNSRLRSSAR